MDRSISAFELATTLTVQNRLYVGTAREGGGSCSQELVDAFAGDGAAAQDLAGTYSVASAFMAGDVVNFRYGDLAYTRGERELLKRLRLTALLALVLVLLLFSETGVRYLLMSRDIATLDRSIGSIYREIFPSRKKSVDPVGEVRAEIRRLGQDGSGHKVLPVLKTLAELKGSDISGLYEIEIDGANVRLKGDAKSVQAANEFKTRSSAFFTNAEVSELKTRGDGGVSFVFRGVAGEVGE
jgi:general secretion pathway protein L